MIICQSKRIITNQLKLTGTVFFYWDALVNKINENRTVKISGEYKDLKKAELKDIDELICNNV